MQGSNSYLCSFYTKFLLLAFSHVATEPYTRTATEPCESRLCRAGASRSSHDPQPGCAPRPCRVGASQPRRANPNRAVHRKCVRAHPDRTAHHDRVVHVVNRSKIKSCDSSQPSHDPRSCAQARPNRAVRKGTSRQSRLPRPGRAHRHIPTKSCTPTEP